jgi:hypothetical protein
MRRPAQHRTRFVTCAIVAAVVSCAVAGCAGLPPADGPLRPWQVAEVDRYAQRLRGSPQVVDDPALERWIGDLLRRIDPEHGARLEVFVLDRPGAQADLVGGRLLRLRTGLLRELRDVDELYFVLAHELAHRRLGHFASRVGSEWDADAAEIEADREAQRALLRLGFPPDTGLELLRRLAARRDDAAVTASIRQRIEAMERTGAEPAADLAASVEDADRFERLLAPFRSR